LTGLAGRRRIGVAAAGLATFLNLYATQAILPTLAREFGATLPRAGLTLTATLLAVALIAPFVGGVSDALGRRRLIVGASMILIAPTMLAAASPGLDVLILCRFVQGLLLPFIFAVTVAYIAEECPGPEGIQVTGTYAMGTIFGGFLGRFVAGWTTQYLGWRASFVVLGALTLGCAAAIRAFLPAEVRFQPVSGIARGIAGFADQLRNPQVIATCAVGFSVLFSMVATFTYANVLLAAPPYGFGPAQLGSVFVIYLLGMVATPVATRLALQFGRRRTVLLAAVVAVAGLLLTLLPSLAAILLGMALAAAGIFTEQVLSLGYVAAAARGSRSTAVGLYVTSYYIGGSMGGILPASVWAHAGWSGCVALVVAVQVAAVVVTQAAWPRHTPAPAMPP
jgi:YNFM family putative membrane transporter